MSNHNLTPVRAKNYLCFGDEPQGFDEVKPINLIVGKNNTGKSALVSIAQYVTSPNGMAGKGFNGGEPVVLITYTLDENVIKRVFQQSSGGGNIPGPGMHYDYGLRYLNKTINFILGANNTLTYTVENNPHLFVELDKAENYERGNKLAQNYNNVFSKFKFKMISAERDIKPEQDSSLNAQGLQLRADGTGATNVLQNVINDKKFNESLVKDTLLSFLNEIYGTDGNFTDISTQRDSNTGDYEIFLRERGKKDKVPLSLSGSGFKTVILLLVNVLLVPEIEGNPKDHYFFAFEELENNLHPSLQRRLISFLIKQVQDGGLTLFLTTHSNVIIDMLAHREDTQIIHVRHDGVQASLDNISSYQQHRDILDDLDYRASDILQSNGVIWVEGPSDRVYIKKWIDIASAGQIEENVHYQFVYYAGSLRKHLSAEDPNQVEAAISVFKINRNCIVVSDSDKKSSSTKLDKHKVRLQEEIAEFPASLSLVTAGKDIENYIHPAIVQKIHELPALPRSIGLYEEYGDYLSEVTGDATWKDRFERNKVDYAEKVIDFLDMETMSVYKLPGAVADILGKIKVWNRIDL